MDNSINTGDRRSCLRFEGLEFVASLQLISLLACRSPLRTNSSLTIRLNGKEEGGGYQTIAAPPPSRAFVLSDGFRKEKRGVLIYPGGQFSQPSIRQQVVKTETRGFATHLKCGAKARTMQHGVGGGVFKAWLRCPMVL